MKQEAEGNREEVPPETRHNRVGIPTVHGGEHVKAHRLAKLIEASGNTGEAEEVRRQFDDPRSPGFARSSPGTYSVPPAAGSAERGR